MSILITIQGTPIEFPSSGESPDWSEAVIQFAEAVEGAIASVAGTNDVPPQTYSLVSNVNTNVSIPNLSFSTSSVRSAFIRYALFRSTNSTTAYETGDIEVVYNPSGSVSSKWEISRSYVGNGLITFSISDTGQMSFSTSSLSGSSHTGTLTYTAQALAQS